MKKTILISTLLLVTTLLASCNLWKDEIKNTNINTNTGTISTNTTPDIIISTGSVKVDSLLESDSKTWNITTITESWIVDNDAWLIDLEIR